jgi:hypothetical protein
MNPRKSKEKPRIELASASYKLYYVNYNNGLIPLPQELPRASFFVRPFEAQTAHISLQKDSFLYVQLFFGRNAARLDLGDFVIEVLLEDPGIGADNPAAVDEDCRRTANVQEIAIGDVRIDKLGGLG